MSKESLPEVTLKSEQPKLDTSHHQAQQRLQNEAIKDLSSQPTSKEPVVSHYEGIYESQKGKKFQIWVHTDPKAEFKHRHESINNQPNTKSPNSNEKLNDSTDQLPKIDPGPKHK